MSRPIWYDSAETGAPTLNNAAGSLLEVLRACLINGFNLKTVTSIVVASGVATATAATHGYSSAYGKLLRVEGAPVAGLNGDVQPLTVDTNTFTYACPGVPDGTYTGTITARRAPLGWAEPHTGTNVAMFARTAPEATAMQLRVNDSNSAPASATDARIIMVEAASDVNTWSNESPLNANQADGLYWYKGANNATAKPWAIVGNDRFIFPILPMNGGSVPYNMVVNYFGDIYPYVTPAPYACVLCGSISGLATTGMRGGFVSNYQTVSALYAEVIARGADGATRGVPYNKFGPGASTIGSETAMQVNLANVPIFRPVHVSANDLVASNGGVRGEIPGLAIPLARAPFLSKGQFAVVTSTEGDIRKYLSVLFTLGGGQNGNLLIDLTGPWH